MSSAVSVAPLPVTELASVSAFPPPAVALNDPAATTGAPTVVAPVDALRVTLPPLMIWPAVETPVTPLAETLEPLVTADETCTALMDELNDTLPPPVPVLEIVLIGALMAIASVPEI